MMKPALTTTTTILSCVLAAGFASAQSPSIIQNTRKTMNTVSNNATAASNEALGVHQSAPVPAPASATHAPAKPRGVAVVTPVKSSSTSPRVGASSASAKKKAGAKPVVGVVAGRKAQAKPAPTVPKSNPPAAASAAGNGASR